MKLEIANHSCYSKIGEKEHKLRKIYHAFDQKKAALEEILKVQRETIQGVISEQEKSGIDIVTDGLILWNDPISHLMKKVSGVEVGGLLRWFDTNFYFRQPTIVGPLSRKAFLIKEEASFLRKMSKKQVKAVLTGPYTLAFFSKINTPVYKKFFDVADVLTEILAQEVKELSGIGVDHIQIEEPAYLISSFQEEGWKWAKQSLQKLAQQKGKSKLWLTTYFGDALPHYSKLQEFPVDVLGLDCTYSPSLVSHIQKQGSQKELALGLIDGRNTKLENSKDVVKALRSIASVSERFKNDKLFKKSLFYLTPSCGLEYLPRERAAKKIKLLKEIKRDFEKRS